MPKFTVIGYYPDNGEGFTSFYKADSPEEAAEKAFDAVTEGLEFVVVEVIRGKHHGTIGWPITGEGRGKTQEDEEG